MIEAVLWDVGGPINDETEQEQRFDDAALAAARTRRDVSAEEYVDIGRRAVESFAPYAYRFILWELAQRDRETYDALRAEVDAADYARFNLRPEVPGILASQAERYRLGLAANSGTSMLDRLAEAGILQHFASQKPGAAVSMSKPDPRYFELLVRDLGVASENTVMIGDRIDCDVIGSRLAGMKSVRLRVGRHKDQEPRTPDEMPDAEIEDITQLNEVLNQW